MHWTISCYPAIGLRSSMKQEGNQPYLQLLSVHTLHIKVKPWAPMYPFNNCLSQFYLSFNHNMNRSLKQMNFFLSALPFSTHTHTHTHTHTVCHSFLYSLSSILSPCIAVHITATLFLFTDDMNMEKKKNKTTKCYPIITPNLI